ncbi:MAG: acyltransferase family protein [Rubrivivax sp.]
MFYRPEVDGLRALAVVPVILFHAGLPGFGGGFVGVDVFFVISGFLITSIIAGELDTGRFSVAGFYERRARRILPALFVVLAACLPFAWAWMLPRDLGAFADSLAATAGFASNVLFWRSADYFDSAAELKPLLHTWSLAVEEQYYLLFPPLLVLLWRLPRQRRLALLAALGAASLALAQWASRAAPTAAFYLLPTRGWELLVGSLLALAGPTLTTPVQASRALAETGGALGLGLLAAAVFGFDRQTPFPGAWALVPTLGAALLILCATPRTVAGRLLGSRPLVGLGLLSYSAYLWHQPLLALARHRSLQPPGHVLLAGVALASLGLAYASWRWVERPFRRPGRFDRREVFMLAATGSVAFFAAGLAGHLAHGFPGRLPPAAQIAELELPRVDNGWCFYSVDSIASLPVGEAGQHCWRGAPDGRHRVLLFGDSFAAQYEPLWDRVGRQDGLAVHVVTTNWCHPALDDDFAGPRSSRAFGQCLANRRLLRATAARYDLVVLGGAWGNLQRQGRLDGVLQTLATLSAQVRRVVVMPAPRQYDADVTSAFLRARLHGEALDVAAFPAGADAASRLAHERLRDAAQRLPNVLFVPREQLFATAAGPSEVDADGVPYSLEGWHVSIRVARAAAENFLASPSYRRLRAELASSSPP